LGKRKWGVRSATRRALDWGVENPFDLRLGDRLAHLGLPNRSFRKERSIRRFAASGDARGGEFSAVSVCGIRLGVCDR